MALGIEATVVECFSSTGSRGAVMRCRPASAVVMFCLQPLSALNALYANKSTFIRIEWCAERRGLCSCGCLGGRCLARGERGARNAFAMRQGGMALRFGILNPDTIPDI